MHFIGIDVSRDKLDCAIVAQDGSIAHGSRSFKNAPEGIRALLKWSRKIVPKGELRFILEATAAYHEMAALSLFEASGFVSVVNPFHVRSLARGLSILGKTDAIDSIVLAHYGRLANPRRWSPPAPELVVFQALQLRLDAIEADLLREKNRREQAVARMTSRLVIGSIEASITFLSKQRKALERTIREHLAANPPITGDVERLRSIPGVGEKTSNRMAALLRMHSFKSAREAAAFLGLVPVEHSSGTSVRRRPRLSKAGNPRIRAALYMAAVVAIRVNPDVKDLYERLVARGKAKLAALGACMRKLVHICFGVLKSGGLYEARASAAI